MRSSKQEAAIDGNLLGCVLAGGQGSRFGSDKALALLNGETLLDHAIAVLAQWCGTVVVAGRSIAPVVTIPDWPRAGMGPLGGIAAGLRHAREAGFAEVLICGVDSVGLPPDSLQRLRPAPACFASQPVVGLWPVCVLPVLEDILLGSGSHSMMNLARRSHARMVDPACAIGNINRPDDLARLSQAD
ncbi:molybdenum cofactor guanylyltransferase [Croceicoccus sp. F390]|uniref:Molybdenum cofactor guanylyltransferase n=1 Tax=Croceicoccus esteveae TaxID=3075597 RepID=A0ABU2ZFS9_9SPHN|nr:molybdenum cofactor guanylyltransferase [Croceicoccus sp. F390]MDT0575454.1 molybdenum cofactor guanylyltransferase [Croceicoccus sp. F390]